MHSFSAPPANFHYTARIHPALFGFADDVCGFLAPLSAYLMALALLVIGAIGAWEHLLAATAIEPSDKNAWSLADRSARAFVVSQHDKTETYEVFRHPGGGRKEVLRWRDADRKPVSELEIYRPGGEFTQPSLAIADIAGRMDPDAMRELEAGNDPKLAELFARAELRRSGCTASAAPALSADWLTGTSNPQLRGAL